MQNKNIKKFFTERTSLKTTISSLLVTMLGATLIILADTLHFLTPPFQNLVREFGSLLFVSVAISLIWELSAKRDFLQEALAVTRLTGEIESSGLIGLSSKFQGAVDWPRLFHSAEQVKIFFGYGRTWRNTYREEILAFAKRKNIHATIVLPDPNNKLVIDAICARTGISSRKLEDNIKEAVKDFITIFDIDKQASSKLSIWYIPFAPTYSYYCFDDIAIFTLYQHRTDRYEVPVFLAKKGGTLFSFFDDEFDNFIGGTQPRGIKVFPK